jgi:Helix-turn-helix domain
VEHHKADMRQVAGRVASVDDAARFLRELRQLRDGAGLGHAELAARAHYPYDSIKAAEVGPALPDLPVLSAFVRGCGGTTEEWEERWRSLTRTPSLPVAEARSAGNSAAAVAGARIGSVAQVSENPDPSLIIAALSRVAEGMASGTNDTPSMSGEATASWPDFPAEAPAASLTPDGEAGLPPVFQPEQPAAFESDGPAGFQAEAPAAFASDGPAGFQAEAPAAFASDGPVGFPPEAPAASVVTPGLWGGPTDEPGGGKPKGWDPIRVSTAWPAIPASLVDMTPSADTVPPWNSAAPPNGWWELPGESAGTAGRTRAAAARPSRAREGGGGLASSRTTIVVVAVVLVCVLAVVLAIFA